MCDSVPFQCPLAYARICPALLILHLQEPSIDLLCAPVHLEECGGLGFLIDFIAELHKVHHGKVGELWVVNLAIPQAEVNCVLHLDSF